MFILNDLSHIYPKNLIFIMRQVKASKTKLDVSEQIFDATDRLMAKEGITSSFYA